MSARRRWYPFPHLDRREAEIKDGDGERQIPGGNIWMFEHLDIFTQLYLKPADLGTFKAYEPIKTLQTVCVFTNIHISPISSNTIYRYTT